MPKLSIDNVFGISRDVPLNYTVRKSVDEAFINNLARDKHIVVYGSSKQGKTCLRKHGLKDDDCVVVHCSNRWTLRELHGAILKQVGFETTESTTRTASGKAKLSIKASVPWVSSVGVDAGAEAGGDQKTVKRPLDIDAEDVNDIIWALESIEFSKFIVLEDFHYLPSETQRDFSVALKAFHENSKLCFIVVGVWLEENRLTVYNGDLTGRVVAVNADAWTAEELGKVLECGANLLNIKFDPSFVSALVGASQGSVYVVQECAYRACEQAGIHSTQDAVVTVGTGLDVEPLITDVVNQQRGRYHSFLAQFADGFQDTQLQMYRWLLYPILVEDSITLERGIRLNQIRARISSAHPQRDGLNPGNVTQALKSAADLQVKKDIKPIILDYDQTNLRLNIVDRGFLIWLSHQDRNELLEMVGLPVSEPDGSAGR